MSPPREQQLQQVLASDEARAWLDELVAGFFDGDARRHVLDAVHAGVPALAPGLDADGLRQLAAGVFQELCRQASRRARTPALPPPPQTAPLTGVALAQEVVGRYPHPVALAYQALGSADSPAAEFGCLLILFETLVHYLGTVAISAYLRGNRASPDCDRHLAGLLAKGKWSTGDLFALLRDTLRHAGDCGGRLPYPDLPGFLFRRGRLTEAGEVLASFVTLRNEEWGHGGSRTDDYFAPLVEANRPRLEALLAGMPWLAEAHLIRPVVLDGPRVTQADVFQGVLRHRRQEYALDLDPRDVEADSGDLRADREALLLVTADRQRYLPLFPPVQYRVASQGTYFLYGLEWSRERGRLRKAVYLAYHCPKQPRHEELPREFAANCLERQLGPLLSLVVAAAPATEADEAAEGLERIRAGVRAEQRGHLAGFVGRAELLGELAGWIDAKTEGGYLLLLGPPGQGKSALMAALAEREERRGGCLLHMVKSHPQPLRFVPALVRAAAELAQTRFGAEAYCGDLDDLRNALVRALEAVRDRAGRAVLVLDALDELEATGGRLAFLPPRLPAGVRVVLTCRPDIPLVNALRARLHGNLEERAVPPLSAADFRGLLERRLPAAALPALERCVSPAELFRRMDGNPLFLLGVVDDLAARWAEAERTGRPLAVALDQLPTTLAAVMRDVYDRIRGRREGGPVPAEGRQRARLLQLLCVAREPLGLDALCGLMTAWGEPLFLEDCRDRVEEMSQWLLEATPGTFKPWHQGLTDYVRTAVLGEAGARQAEEAFCGWLATREGAASGYGLRHRVRHLLAAGRVEDAARLLTDLAELEARAEAGLVLELAGDFTAAAQALPEGEGRRRLELLKEALRHDLHFLARHPGCLFQCLWNSAWWYDCPDAAAHYEEGRAPGQAEGVSVHRLLERWRQQKEQRRPGFPWLRSLRPPPVHLGTALRAVLRGHEGDVNSVCYSPDGRWLASGGEDRTVRVWDATTGNQFRCLQAHRGGVRSVAFSSDGRTLASASRDRTVRVWDVAGGVSLLRLEGHRGGVRSVAFAPDGRTLASGGSDGTVRVWDAGRGAALRCLEGHGGPVSSVAFAPDGCTLASGSDDRTVRVWDAASGAPLLCLEGHEGWVQSVAFAPDSRTLASGAVDGTVRIWDATRGTQLACGQGHVHTVLSVTYTPDGRILAGGADDGAVRVWDTARGALLFDFEGHGDKVLSVALAPDGRTLASGSNEGMVGVWNTADRVPLLRLRGHGGAVRGAAFAPDGGTVATASLDGTVRIWDAATGVERRCLPRHGGGVLSVAFAPGSRTLASGASDRAVRLWDTASGALLLRLEGHDGWVRGVAFAPDGLTLASASLDGTVRVWDAVGGAQRLCLQGHGGWVWGVRFATDGRTLASASYDRTVRVWDAFSGACLEVISGTTSMGVANTGDATGSPWRAVSKRLETVIESGATQQAIAWFPRPLTDIVLHPSGRAWAGGIANHLCLFTLEGAPLG